MESQLDWESYCVCVSMCIYVCACMRVYVCMCIYVYVCVLLVQGQQHDPHHFSPSGLCISSVSPAVLWLTPSLPSHTCSHSGASWQLSPPQRPAAVKKLRVHLLTLPCLVPA